MSLHHTNNISKINLDLQRTGKLLIAIGDSFTYGDATWDDELFNLYPPIYKDYNISYDNYDLDIKKKICNLYPDEIYLQDNNKLNFSQMFQKNAYVNVLGGLLGDSWTVANLGVCARGNFSSISYLFMVGIDWSLVKNMTLIFMPSSMNRIDTINDGFIPSKYSSLEDLFVTAWVPKYQDGLGETPWNRFQDSLYDSTFSEKYEVLKTILEFQHLNTWVKLHKANLIVIPAFSDYYYPEYFSKKIKMEVQREDPSRELTNFTDNEFFPIENYVEYIPWDKIYHPHNFHSFYHYALSQVDKNSNNVNMLSLIGKPSKDNWIMHCGHPSKKSHKLIAEYIYGLIKKPLI
jgi:hypothetical protein